MIPPNKTALVHDWLTVPGGAEEVLREVFSLFPYAPILTAQYNQARFPWLSRADVRSTWVSKLPLSKSHHYLYAPILADVYRRMDASEFDLLLTDSHSFAHHVRKRPGALHVCYYHTPARSLWLPEIDPRAGNDAIRRLIAKRLRRLDLEASKNPDVVLANSHTTAERIKRTYGRDVEEVIYPPVYTSKWHVVNREGDDEGFLMWGRLIGYKRVDLAIESAKSIGARLNIVGDGPLRPALERLAAGHSNIRFHGRLADGDLKALMGRCRGVLFPGYEDFGIVPVEAMAAGLPVVCYGQGGAAETVASDCGVQFKEQTSASLASAILEVQKKSFDPEVLRARAALYDVSVFRGKYRSAIDRAIESHSR